jgi:predicted RecA/RadA family phage recombinase
MKNFVKDGKTMTWTNATGTAVKSGDLVPVGDTFGVAAGDIANGAIGELCMEGVFTLPAVNNAAFAQGKPVYYAASTGELSLVAEDQKFVGITWAAKAETGATAQVKIGGYHPVVNDVA